MSFGGEKKLGRQNKNKNTNYWSILLTFQGGVWLLAGLFLGRPLYNAIGNNRAIIIIQKQDVSINEISDCHEIFDDEKLLEDHKNVCIYNQGKVQTSSEGYLWFEID